jgi:flagellar basal-body rod protein FlgF
MADGIYVSMCGAAARTEQLDAIAENLANAQTPGFKAARPAFEAFFPASGAPDTSYPASLGTPFDLRPGPTARSGEPLDVLPEGGAFLAVQTADGGRAFTRDGRLSVDATTRRLVQGGRPVLDRAGAPITVPPGATPSVDASGTVSVEGMAVGALGLFQLQGAVDRVGPALYAPGGGGSATPVVDGLDTRPAAAPLLTTSWAPQASWNPPAATTLPDGATGRGAPAWAPPEWTPRAAASGSAGAASPGPESAPGPRIGTLDDEVAAMLALRSDIQEQALSELSQLSAYRPQVVQGADRLTRRVPTVVPEAPQIVESTTERDPNAVRSRLASFQSGTARGRRDAGRDGETS